MRPPPARVLVTTNTPLSTVYPNPLALCSAHRAGASRGYDDPFCALIDHRLDDITARALIDHHDIHPRQRLDRRDVEFGRGGMAIDYVR